MSKLKTGVLVLVALLVAAISGGLVGGGAAIALVKNAYNGPTGPAIRPEVLVNSDALGEPMILRVHLPVEYASDPERRFPVLWVLDGPSRGGDVARTIQTLSRIDVVPASIVVEVPRSSRGRTVDFTPPWQEGLPDAQADRFLRFIQDEAVPAVGEAYRVDGSRVLVGHSLGGLFALYAILQEPSFFDAYFAFSPSVWVGDDAILGDFQGVLGSGGSLPTNLYMSLGAEEGNRMLSGFQSVEGLLQSAPGLDLRWQADITSGADHGTNPTLSFPVAAQWFWAR